MAANLPRIALFQRKVMTTLIEAVFENGVFRPPVEADFKKRQRYTVIVENG
jgi:predicted DNA-binding antitoxin AbrB/MazE fold protein